MTMAMCLPSKPVQWKVSAQFFMTKKPATATLTHEPPVSETEHQRFERILLREQFKPLKAVFDHLGMTIPVMQAAIVTTNAYQMFLAKLGYRVIMVKQIHEQDCYSRLGRRRHPGRAAYSRHGHLQHTGHARELRFHRDHYAQSR